jgi:hypothetical protein
MAFLATARSLGATLVLRRFHVAKSPTDGLYVEIVGRPEGILGWLLTTLGLDAQVTFHLTDTHVSIESSGLQGKSKEIAPISNVASASVGYMKSIWTLILGLLAVVYGLYKGLMGGSVSMLIVGLVIGGVLLALYWFSNRLHIAVITNGGSVLGLRFKRSVIEGVAVDFEKCASVVEVLQGLMLAAQSRRDNASLSPKPRAGSPPPADATRPSATGPGFQAAAGVEKSAGSTAGALCAKCGARLEPASKFCESCGAPVGTK